jgi:crotonobetainyl-CoA:carnitine CoA-transferase CaiB-like acyl-CoA transferase
MVMDQVVDQFVSIVAADDEDWKRLARAIGRPELGNDAKFATFTARKQNEDELESVIEQWTSTRSAEDVQQTLQEAGVAALVVADNKYLSEEDPHSQGARLFRLSRASRGRREAACWDTVEDEPHRMQSARSGAANGAA